MNLGCLENGHDSRRSVGQQQRLTLHTPLVKQNKIGSLEVGKQADVAIFGVSNYLKLSYNYGMNHIDQVIKKGKVSRRKLDVMLVQLC